MDRKVLDSLEEIDAAAEKILSQADGRKTELSSQMDEKIAAFDRDSDAESRKEIEQLRSDLEKHEEEALSKLQASTDAELKRLETDFLDKKEEIADRIVRQILQ